MKFQVLLFVTYTDNLLIRFTDQPVVEYTKTLVLPQSDKLSGSIKPVGRAKAKSLGDAG